MQGLPAWVADAAICVAWQAQGLRYIGACSRRRDVASFEPNMEAKVSASQAVPEQRWQAMASAPKDGSRILVVIRASEQGGSDVDVVRWARPTRGRSDDCWISTDSSADCPINYEDWEVAFWMPLPSSIPPVRTPDLSARLPRAPQKGEETGGSGI